MDYPEVPYLEVDDLESQGVLISQDIQHYAKMHDMITPFEESCLKAAGYELRLGKEYAMGGQRSQFDELSGNIEITIPPFQVIIISTLEEINLPRFMIARWNLRVKKVYEGLLWSGALQVDPGWHGHLYCPIYNLSNKPVKLKYKERIVLMDFVKTTKFIKNTSKEYPPPRRISLEDYNWGLESALFTETGKRIDAIENTIKNDIGLRVDKFERLIGTFQTIIGIMFTCIAISFTAISIFVTSARDTNVLRPPVWLYISLGMSVTAISISLFSYFSKSKREKLLRDLFIFCYIIMSGILLVYLLLCK